MFYLDGTIISNEFRYIAGPRRYEFVNEWTLTAMYRNTEFLTVVFEQERRSDSPATGDSLRMTHQRDFHCKHTAREYFRPDSLVSCRIH